MDGFAAGRTADGLMGAMTGDGHLPGRLNPDWSSAEPWVCLTGSAQVAHCWLLLHIFTGEETYKRAGQAANRFVRRTVRTNGAPEIRGGVKGSFPVDGDYGKYEYLNWAGKFLIDSLILERSLGLEKA